MFGHLMVPVDLSHASLDVIPLVARMADQYGVGLDVVTVVERLADVALARDQLAHAMERAWPLPLEPNHVVLTGPSVAEALAKHVERTPGAIIAMSSHGHGRSAAVLGSTAEDVLMVCSGPLIVIGPRAADGVGALGGEYVVPLDRSEMADHVLPVAAAWAGELSATPWLIEVLQPDVGAAEASSCDWFLRGRATDLARRLGRSVETAMLHSTRVASSIVDFAESQNASLIFMTTHGRTGVERLTTGSVAADVVRHARIPVVMVRPPRLRSALATVPVRAEAVT